MAPCSAYKGGRRKWRRCSEWWSWHVTITWDGILLFQGLTEPAWPREAVNEFVVLHCFCVAVSAFKSASYKWNRIHTYQCQSHLLNMWIGYICLLKCYQVEFSCIFWNWCQILQLTEISKKYTKLCGVLCLSRQIAFPYAICGKSKITA